MASREKYEEVKKKFETFSASISPTLKAEIIKKDPPHDFAMRFSDKKNGVQWVQYFEVADQDYLDNVMEGVIRNCYTDELNKKQQ